MLKKFVLIKQALIPKNLTKYKSKQLILPAMQFVHFDIHFVIFQYRQQFENGFCKKAILLHERQIVWIFLELIYNANAYILSKIRYSSVH